RVHNKAKTACQDLEKQRLATGATRHQVMADTVAGIPEGDNVMKKYLMAAVMSAACLAPTMQAHAADNYPSQPLRFIVPLGPGSGADTNTRVLADGFQKLTGQPVVVENRPGADLILGTTTALNAPADGYTVVLI